MAARTVNILGLCSGLGWLEWSIAEAFRQRGLRARTVCHCEWEAVTAALLSRVQVTAGHAAPIWDDISTFDGTAWRGVVDCVVAGLPCPAYSCAGTHGGNDDERAWGPTGDTGPQFHFLRIVREIMPAFVFLENVPQFVSDGHFRRLGDGLLELGYGIAPAVFLPARSVGAVQIRERVFVLACRQDAYRWCELKSEQQAQGRRTRPTRISSDVGGAKDCNLQRNSVSGPHRERGEDRGPGGNVGNSSGSRLETEELQTGRIAKRSDGLGLNPPGRGHWTDPEWQRVIELDAACTPAIEPGFSALVDGMAVPASDLLRIGGNGVVPMAAAVACGVLLDYVSNYERARGGA